MKEGKEADNCQSIDIKCSNLHVHPRRSDLNTLFVFRERRVQGCTAAPGPVFQIFLSLDIHQYREHLIRCRDDLGIGLIGPLGRDHVDEFLRHVRVGHFKLVGHNLAQPPGTGPVFDGLTGIGRLTEIVADLLQPAGVWKIRHDDLPEFGSLAVCKGPQNSAVHPDVHAFQDARGIPVVGQGLDDGCTGEACYFIRVVTDDAPGDPVFDDACGGVRNTDCGAVPQIAERQRQVLRTHIGLRDVEYHRIARGPGIVELEHDIRTALAVKVDLQIVDSAGRFLPRDHIVVTLAVRDRPGIGADPFCQGDPRGVFVYLSRPGDDGFGIVDRTGPCGGGYGVVDVTLVHPREDPVCVKDYAASGQVSRVGKVCVVELRVEPPHAGPIRLQEGDGEVVQSSLRVENTLGNIEFFTIIRVLVEVDADTDLRRRLGGRLDIFQGDIGLFIDNIRADGRSGGERVVTLHLVVVAIHEIALFVDMEIARPGVVDGAFLILDQEETVPVDGQIGRISRRFEGTLGILRGHIRHGHALAHGEGPRAGKALVEHAGEIGVARLVSQGIGIGQVVSDHVHLFRTRRESRGADRYCASHFMPPY